LSASLVTFKLLSCQPEKLQRDTNKEFWAWCYRIARNKLSVYFRQQYAERVQPLPPAELLQMMETRARPIGFSL
jgi:DNA-directed RNA polymerase specialized sigma24 family protein